MATNIARYRNYATIVYPESAPDGWVDVLRDEHVPAFVSPLHDKDVDKDGNLKKPHHHVIVMYEGKKSLSQVTDLFERIGAVGVEVVQSIKGYSRYMCHLDEDDTKVKYSPDDVICCSGADYGYMIDLPVDRLKYLRDMQDFCSKYNVRDFSLLCDYCAVHKPAWHKVLAESSAYYMSRYLDSRRNRVDDHIFDPVSGDIIF